MSPLEKRAWLMLWSMCPPYLVYFTIQFVFPELLPTYMARLTCLLLVAGTHAVVYLAGWLVLKRLEAGEKLLSDERDHAIDGRAIRIAYCILIFGLLLVGAVMPFGHSGWALVNGALFFVVLAETVRCTWTILGYRRPRLAH